MLLYSVLAPLVLTTVLSIFSPTIDTGIILEDIPKLENILSKKIKLTNPIRVVINFIPITLLNNTALFPLVKNPGCEKYPFERTCVFINRGLSQKFPSYIKVWIGVFPEDFNNPLLIHYGETLIHEIIHALLMENSSMSSDEQHVFIEKLLNEKDIHSLSLWKEGRVKSPNINNKK